MRPRRGVVRTRPRAARLAAADHDRRRREAAAAAAIVLELGDAPHAGVPCWTRAAQRWATWTVPIAYDCRYDTEVRPAMGANQISRTALLAVAEARARYADHATGRNSRPSNERLAADTGYSVRTVQRADTALRLLGVATEVLRGRQRTRIERLASWRVGDRHRGWASVWALHDNALLNRLIHKLKGALSPHPRSGPVRDTPSVNKVLTTDTGGPAGHRQGGAPRRRAPDGGGAALARAWRADTHAPPWAQRHTPQAWAAILAGPAAHGWTPRDLNTLITDWAAVTGQRIPDRPHKPIGLLGAILAWHGHQHLDARPAAHDEARQAAELAAARARVAAAEHQHREQAAARARGKAAAAGPGHAAAFAVLADVRRRAAHRGTAQAAAEQARVDELIDRARRDNGRADDYTRRDLWR